MRYEYDSAGRLRRVTNDVGNWLQDNNYGSGRQRVFRNEPGGSGLTWYVWGGDSVLAEYTSTSWGGTYTWAKSYIYAGSRLLFTATNNGAGGELKEYHHPDRLGTRMVTDPAANTLYLQSTLPFGTQFDSETTGSSNRLFTSYDRSAGTGLDYAVNRTYSPGQGRFTQVDPSGMSAVTLTNPQSLNLMAYVQNDPVDFVDPQGLNLFACQAYHYVHDGGEKDGQPAAGYPIRVVCYDLGGGGAGGGGDSGDGGGGVVSGSPDNTGPKADFDIDRFDKCLKDLFNATRDKTPGTFLFRPDIGGRFTGTIDGRDVNVVTSIDQNSTTLGLDLKHAGVQKDSSPNSGATLANFPTRNNVASDVVNDPNLSIIGKFALFVHELGNALQGQRFLNGTSEKQIGDFGKMNRKFGIKDSDAGAALERCVFRGIVGLRSGRVGTSREFPQ